MLTLISPTTSAVTTKAKFQVTRDNLPVTISAPGLATTEECDIYYSQDGGTTWSLLYDDGSAVVLTATKTAISVYAPILLGVVKDATASAVGVYVDKGV